MFPGQSLFYLPFQCVDAHSVMADKGGGNGISGSCLLSIYTHFSLIYISTEQRGELISCF